MAAAHADSYMVFQASGLLVCVRGLKPLTDEREAKVGEPAG